MDNVIGNGVEKVMDEAAEHVIGAAVGTVDAKKALKYAAAFAMGAATSLGLYKGWRLTSGKIKAIVAKRKAAEAEPVEAEATEATEE